MSDQELPSPGTGSSFPPLTPLAWRPVGIICHPSELKCSSAEVKLHGGTVKCGKPPEDADRTDQPASVWHRPLGVSQLSEVQKLDRSEEKENESDPESKQNLSNKKGVTIANFEIGEIRNSEEIKIGKMAEESAKVANSPAKWHESLIQIGKNAISEEKSEDKNVEFSKARKATKLAKRPMKIKTKILRIQNKNCETATRPTKIQLHRVESRRSKMPKMEIVGMRNHRKTQQWSSCGKISKTNSQLQRLKHTDLRLKSNSI